tara:strand:- start:2098 stop:2289 length:192 start_codon:yes stop_codon:yes gene_type:complete
MDYFNQAQALVMQNPWVVLIVLAVVYWFVIRPRMASGNTVENYGDNDYEMEGFSAGQSVVSEE